MDSLFDTLNQQLQGQGVEQIAQQLGIDSATAAKAVPAALGSLMGGLANNAASSGGAEALAGALSRDHDGSILDNLTGALGGAGGLDAGAGILKHVFGPKEPAVEAGLGQSTGLDASTMSQLLKMLAPIVMGALGKTQRDRGLDMGGLTDLLGGEKKRVQQEAPAGMDMLGKILDSDGDGQIADDLTRIGGGLLGKFLGGK